jgi:hypothetical protein
MKNLLNMKMFKICVAILTLICANFTLLANGPSKLPPVPSGTYSVGPGSPTYTTTIAAAIASINGAGGVSGAIILELNAAYNPAAAELLGPVTGASTTNTITIRPAVGVTKTISLGSTLPVFQITGGKYYIIDGQAGGISGTKDLTIINTNTGSSASTLRFQNDASNNIVKNCILKGQNSTATIGIVLFGITTGSTGNDNNTVTNCDITSVSAGALATYGVYSLGTSGKSNDANTISNCNIYDIFNASAKSVGVLMAANTSGWTVSDNSFYQTTSRSTSATWSAIELNNKAAGGNGFTISNNFIGGTAPLAASGTMTFTHTSTGNFSGISIYGFSGASANTISGNTLKNISITCNQTNLHFGIYHSDGTVNISGNTVGDLISTGSIVFNSTAPTASFVSPAFTAICGGGGSTSGTIGGNVNIQNNSIGSITSNATALTAANEFRGIFYQGSSALAAVSIVNITGNTVGGTIANSLYNTGNGATVGIVVNAGYIAGGAKHTVKDNLVQNISSSNSTTNAATPRTQGSLEGITTQGIANKDASYIVENNIIKDLTANNAYTMVGFKTSATIAPQLITKNKIFNIKNTSNLIGSNVVGIELGYDFITFPATPSATASELSRNIVTNIEMTAATPALGSVAWGISAYAGRFNIMNNMVAMGYGLTNVDITKPYEIIGIANNGVGTGKLAYFNFYYNTIHVGGAGAVTGSPDSKCYYGNNYGTTDLKNNIFYNSRTNASGSTAHYSFLYTNNGTTTSDYNVMSAIGANGIVAGYFNGASTTNYATTDALFAARAIDANSLSATVKFENNATDLRPVPSPDVTNFFIANEALPIAGITTDIDGNTRNSYFPDMGCFEFKGTGCWIGQTSSGWGVPTVGGNWDDGQIPTSAWDVKIFPNVDPAITQPIMISSAGIGAVKDLYLRTTTRATTNASFVTVNTGTLQIHGAIKFRKNAQYNDAIDARFGTVEMKGATGVQTLAPKWFLKREIETLINTNTVGLTIAPPTILDTMLISKALLYGTGTTGSTITTNDNLTLLSRATQTARFGEIVSGSGNTIVGKVTVERFIPNTRKWRLLAWPTNSSQTAKQSWMENAATPNANPKPGYGAIVTDEQASWSANNFDSRSLSGPSVKYYDPATDKFIGIPNTTSYLMNTNTAYYTYIRGDRNCLPSPVTYSNTVLRATGTLNTGNVVYPIMNGKFVAVGNPYASPIDVRKIINLNTTNEFYVWDPKLTGAYGLGAYQLLYKSGADYKVTPGGGSYPSAGSIVDTLESGQGILVRSNGTGAGTLTFNEDAKTIGARTFTRGAGTAQAEVVFALLNIVDPGVNTLVDGAMAAYDNSYSSNVDFDDALKLTNTSENVSFKRSNTLLAIERRSDVMVDDTLHLNMTGLRIKKYQWDVNIANMTNPGRTAILVDRFTNTTTNLSLEGVTNIQFDVTSTAASYAANRFMIVFKQIPMPTTQFTTISAIRNANKTIKVNYAVANETNIASYTIEQSNNGTTFTAIGTQAPVANNSGNPAYSFNDNNASLNNNWYRVKFTSTAGVVSYSAIAMESATPADVIIAGETKMSVYPNPVVGGNVNVHLDNQAKGTYTATVTNKMGQTIKTANIQVNTNTVLQTIKIGNVSIGSYQVTIVDEAGVKTTIPFIVK